MSVLHTRDEGVVMSHCLKCGDIKCIARSADYASIVCMCGGRCAAPYDCIQRSSAAASGVFAYLQIWGFFAGAIAYAPRYAFLIAIVVRNHPPVAAAAGQASLTLARNNAEFRDALCAVADMAPAEFFGDSCRCIAGMMAAATDSRVALT